ncbi:GPR1/FUN34/YaaH family transporter [Terrabacter sp. 2YAF2]|uniref:GPR1/FUN34/YaaH family transporter n=1 Tax=Terrabacter sp. 2YAF2 TaxID=3233026 RepID=UPI003F9AABFC
MNSNARPGRGEAWSSTQPELRVVVRPLGNPLPLGFLALMVATVATAMLQLHVLEPSQGRVVATGILVLTVPLQLVACVLGFLARDPVAGTGMGILAGTWAGMGFALLLSPPGATSSALGVLLLCSAVAMCVPTAASTGKLAALAVMGLSAMRFAVTGIGELTGSQTWLSTAGWVGLLLGLVAAYAALSFELEDVRHAPVLPTGRRAQGADTMTASAAAGLASVPHEGGVRKQL